jgi:hypothetical protein
VEFEHAAWPGSFGDSVNVERDPILSRERDLGMEFGCNASFSARLQHHEGIRHIFQGTVPSQKNRATLPHSTSHYLEVQCL